MINDDNDDDDNDNYDNDNFIAIYMYINYCRLDHTIDRGGLA